MEPPSPSGAEWEVYAACCGTYRSTRSHFLYRYDTYGEPDGSIELAYYFWVLRNANEAIVIDTAFNLDAATRRGRAATLRPREALARLDITSESVSTVLLTHLHYDHTGGIGEFPNAEFVVSRREMDFWKSDVARCKHFAEHAEQADLDILWTAAREGRVRQLDCGADLRPGVRVLEVRGHSPGQLMLVVDRPGGPLVLTSDAVHFYDELETERPFAVVHDLELVYRAYRTVKALAATGASIVPAHDPEVLRRHRPVGSSAAIVRLDVEPVGHAASLITQESRHD